MQLFTDTKAFLATKKTKKTTEVFSDVAFSIKQAIVSNNLTVARSLIKEMIFSDMENPQVYNFLGIIYEMEGNKKNASKCYRVAYSMDQTYKPASINLDRVCNCYYQGFDKIEWGLNEREVKK